MQDHNDAVTTRDFFVYIFFFAVFFLLFIMGWKIQYSGGILESETAEVITRQYTDKYRYRLAKVRLSSGNLVRADCRGTTVGQKVTVAKKQGVISGDVIYECIDL